MRFKKKFIVVSLLLAIWSLANAAIKSSEERAFYGAADKNILVEASNPTFVIKLKSNPSTGYAWFIREYDSNLLEIVGHEYQPANKKLIGASGSDFWTFKVKADAFKFPQQTTVSLVYARPWAASKEAEKLKFTISIMR